MSNSFQLLPKEIIDAPLWVQDTYNAFPALVSYKEISQQTQLAKGTLANMCSRKNGPSGGMIIGKKKVFPRLEVVLWIWELSEKQNPPSTK